MEDLQLRFQAAAQEVQQLARRPDNVTLLQLYALYKQSTMGDVAGQRPGFADLVGRAKHDAWAKLKGTSPETAMQGYIDLVGHLKQQA